MRAMPPAPSPEPAATGPLRATPSPRISSLLLWAGPAACLLGIVVHHLFSHWVPSRTFALLVLAAAAACVALVARRTSRCAWATALAAAWLAALAWFGDPLPMLATVVFAVAAIAAGSVVVGRGPLGLRCVAGLVLLSAMLGWLLPLPVHGRMPYLAVSLMLIAWQRRAVEEALRSAASGWREAVGAAPRSAAWSVLLLGLASTACWVPSMQFDDLAYHLRLPWQLQLDGVYPLEAETQIWALAPWASDVVHAAPQVMAGAESRGAVNALWMALTAGGIWHLAAALGAGASQRWWSVSLYASLPGTAALMLGMQTEPATAALLVWVVVLILQPASARTLVTAALLTGGLAATKLSGALLALLLVPWALRRHLRAAPVPAIAVAAALSAFAAGSSYVYAALATGNPILPLFNAWFQAAEYPPVDFVDVRWTAGFEPLLPWHLTFDTGRYQEAFPGGAGVVMVALAGAWLLAMRLRPTRAVAVVSAAMIALLLLQSQYLRYVYPPLVLVIPALVVATVATDARRGGWLLGAVCLLNVLFQANSHWMLRTGVVKDTVVAAGRNDAVFEAYAPERQLMALMRADGRGRGQVLALDADTAVSAEAGARARTVSTYDPSLAREAADAATDPTGAAWARLFHAHGVSDVLLRARSLTPAQRAGLHAAGASRRASLGEAEWWTLPPAGTQP